MKTSKSQILEKYWKEFRISSGLPYEPMSSKAVECFENAMEEYSRMLVYQKQPRYEELKDKSNADQRLLYLKEVYNKWHELDNDFMFIQWLYNEIKT